MTEVTAIMREFGDSAILSYPLGRGMSKVVEDLLLHRFDELLAHCPDKVFGMEPTIVNPPPIDKLRGLHSAGVKMMFASPIYDYFYSIKEEALKQREKEIKRRLAYQSRKSWWTRLCWKLGGFDVKDESYLDADV